MRSHANTSTLTTPGGGGTPAAATAREQAEALCCLPAGRLEN